MLRLFYFICLGDKGCQEDAKARWESQAMLRRHWGTSSSVMKTWMDIRLFFKWWVCWEDIRGWWGYQAMSWDAEGHWATLGIQQGVLSNIKKTSRGVIYVVERVTMRACWENIKEMPRRHCGTLGSIEKTFGNIKQS
jgi:hypothetical protein